MRIAISNIAWDVEEDELVAELLAKYGIDGIDIAPSKYFPHPDLATDEDIEEVKAYWAEKGIEITGMQSLLFGTQGLNVFGTADIQTKLLAHLESICRIAGKLGSSRLVFGSPKNRDRSGLTDEKTLEQAVQFFGRLGDIAQDNGVIICLEPNPTCYGANFMTTSEETLAVVKAIDHPAIKMQLDTGAITINQELITQVVNAAQSEIGHIHISEPNLSVIGSSDADHAQFGKAIKNTLGDALVTIEMVATKDEPHLVSIERALKLVTQNYRDAL
ncbi:MAG: sugar phosphate isomerase/epimerase [Moraxella osloensis]|nr:sugar phosphate isomerase/epimerase [Moraxella osloensis]